MEGERRVYRVLRQAEGDVEHCVLRLVGQGLGGDVQDLDVVALGHQAGALSAQVHLERKKTKKREAKPCKKVKKRDETKKKNRGT